MAYFEENTLRYVQDLATDFQGAITETGFATTTNGSGAAAALKSTGTAGHPGVAELTTGTTNSGRAALTANITDWWVGSSQTKVFETLIQLPDLSTASEEYSVWLGFGDTATTHDQVDGVYFYYDRANDGDNWFIATANNSTRTETDTGVAVAADTWYHMVIGIDEDGSSAHYYIGIPDSNGVLPKNGDTDVGVISTNLPSASGRAFGRSMGILKSVGTTARTLEIDYVYTKVVTTNNR